MLVRCRPNCHHVVYDVSELISSLEKNCLRLLSYAKPRVVVQLTLTKIIEIVANR